MRPMRGQNVAVTPLELVLHHGEAGIMITANSRFASRGFRTSCRDHGRKRLMTSGDSGVVTLCAAAQWVGSATIVNQQCASSLTIFSN